MWTVPIIDNDAGYATVDDGASSCQPVLDESLAASPAGRAFPDGAATAPPLGQHLAYNALVMLPIEALTVTGPSVVHDAANADVSACDGCAAMQGNSHPYDPYRPLGHGHAPDGGMPGYALREHPTRLVDVYYGAAQAPAVRTNRTIDRQGSLAPFPR